MSELESLIFLILSGLLLRFTLTITGQAWAKSHAQTVTFMVLPVITYVITKTISGNIALSLGMIGALSIVRFRHPVKSALELVMYFALITIGIATSVRTKWAVQLVLCIILVIVFVKIFQKISNKYGRSFYNLSFNEGNTTNSLEVISKKKIDSIEKSDYLANSISDIKSSEYIYRLSFENKNQLEEFKKKLDKDKNIQKINIVNS